ncbi:cytochrome b5 reductase 4 isoform X1 [Monodelphis domestica]|uniref:Cytochrome b5 reductase 4 n=2 Tax=Monodelphis domestica TaxID=13616 RepID=F6RFU2_MONDO|nr:cytochrome b5 reductase 4 isoform X1 [Monodelphis domestica]
MLNVPSQAFPAPGSQQRAASGGRSKVPLKQGRSLMDWIRLTKSGKDLTGLKGRLIEVTEEELIRHNKKDDCWVCIRGLVYNVSPYMEYHPGGEDELMRAAGSDGTDLFDQVHRWVNYESMLKECLVGRMAVKPVAVAKENHEKKLLNGILLKSQVSDLPAKEISPSYDWFQTESLVTIVTYTKQKDMDLESVIVDYQDGSFRAEIIIKDHSYLLYTELSHEIQEDITVHVAEKTGKVEIVLKKKDNISWKYLGHPLENHNSFTAHRDTGLYYRKCQLISKVDVTHDTKLYCLMLPPGTHLQVPIGQHVYLKQTVAGTEIVKPYTPVLDSLYLDLQEPIHPHNKYIYFMMKIYHTGLFTPHFDCLQIGDGVSLSSPEGNFKKSQLQELEELFLLAAGTGFTPMVKILNYALTNITSLRKVKLMFFNKTEGDILWRNQLEQLADKEKRFEVEFILSEPTSEWTGKQGRISLPLLSGFVKRSIENSRVLVCICGPEPFTEQGIRLLKDLNFSKEEIHSFTE